MWERFQSTRGFSLLELLIVIAVIGILAGTLVFSVIKYIEEARYARTRGTIAELETRLEHYKTDSPSRRYPLAEELVSELEKPDRQGAPYYDFKAEILGGPGVKYERVRIMDPDTGALSLLPLPGPRFLLDGFNRPLYYAPVGQYGETSFYQFLAWDDEDGDSVADGNETFYQTGTYQIWSAGADGIVRGVRLPDGRLVPALMLRRDNRDNDMDGAFDKNDTAKSSATRPIPQNLPEDDVSRDG